MGPATCLRRSLLSLVAVATGALLVACSTDAAAPPESPTPEPRGHELERPAPTPTPAQMATPAIEMRGTPPVPPPHGDGRSAWGIAGVVPPNFPESSDDDWRTLYDTLPSLGGWVGTVGAWTPEGGTPDIVRSQAEAGRLFGFRTVPNVSFSRQELGGYRSTVDFSDQEQVDAYTQALVEVARELQPRFLGVGNEVNLLAEADPTAYVWFAARLPAIVDAVHEVSPETRVFTTFQLEFLRGGGAISGIHRAPRWDLVDLVAGAVDFVAFTSYPWFDYQTPAEVPEDYYRSILDHVDAPVGFTEISWPAGTSEDAMAAYGGTPDEQALFAARLSVLLDGVDPELVLWVHAFDTPEAGGVFGSLGLHEADGTARPALSLWRRLILESS